MPFNLSPPTLRPPLRSPHHPAAIPAVLMDWVPRHLRGRVNAVDSVRTFSWSGSAALGGFLIQRYGFQRTFLITAAIKAAAFAPLFVLLAYVPDGVCLPAGKRAARLQRQQQAWQGAPAGTVQVADEQQVLPRQQRARRSVDAGPEQLGGLQQPLLQNGPAG